MNISRKHVYLAGGGCLVVTLLMMAAVVLLLARRTPAPGQDHSIGGDTLSPPSVEHVKSLVDRALQRSKGADITTRTVLFEQVEALGWEGRRGDFRVSATIHDYSAAGGAGKHGRTCVAQLSKVKVEVIVDGSYRLSNDPAPAPLRECRDNPAAHRTAIPLASLPGEELPENFSPVADEVERKRPGARGGLRATEYSCFGEASEPRLTIRLRSDGTYRALSGGADGRWDVEGRTVRFTDGILHGRPGTNIRESSFELEPSLRCEPF